MNIRYPDIEVQLIGKSANAGAIMDSVTTTLFRNGVTSEEIDEYRMEVMQGNYQQLLQTTMRWVSVY